MLGEALQDLANRLVVEVPVGAPRGAVPPAGAVLAVHTPAGGSLAVAGRRTLDPEAPMTPDTVHDLASVTKVAATTAVVMRLVSEGLLQLESTVRRLLPAFTGGHKDEVTVRDLLEHRSGMQEWWPLYIAAARTGSTPEAAYDVVDRLPLHYAPGTGYHYSDLGFVQLGRIVSVVTGLSLPAAARGLVHEPLGLGLGYGPAAGPRVAASAPDDRIEREMLDSGIPYPVPFTSADFPRWRRSTIVGEVHDGNAFHVLGGAAGHAGLFGTVPDLLRLAVAFAHAVEHEALWSPRVVEGFFAVRGSPTQVLGFRRSVVRTDGGEVTVLGHPGFVGAAMAFVPGDDLAVALGTNRLLHGGRPVPTELFLREVLRVAMTGSADAGTKLRPPPGPAIGTTTSDPPDPPVPGSFSDPSRGTP